MSINSEHLRKLIIRPALNSVGLWSECAENLLLGTAAQESKMGYYLAQIKGPALGMYQIEPATHTDIWVNFLVYRQQLSQDVCKWLPLNASHLERERSLIYNLCYSTIMARLVYLRAPGKLPDAKDIEGLAAYWKKHYNTPLGKGTEQEFVHNYKELVK